LSRLEWTLGGYTPTSWWGRSMEMGFALAPEIPDIKARVPGSVQQALREAGMLSDWFEGLNSRACEWVENRDWIFSAKLPDTWFAEGKRFLLRCGGLDGNGIIVFNRKQVAAFDNAYIPYEVDLTAGVRRRRTNSTSSSPCRRAGSGSWALPRR
jgi:beta-mannosidase